jgi:hypothetical protein
MKRPLCALSVATAGFLWAGPTAWAGTAPAGFKMFVSQQGHYQIAYPASWKSVTGSTQFFFGETVHHFRSNVNIMYQSGAGGVSLGTFSKATVAGEKRIGAQIVGTSSVQVGTMHAELIEGRLTPSSLVHVNDEFASVVFLHHGTAWEITLSSDPSVFWTDMVPFRTMLATFTFKK